MLRWVILAVAVVALAAVATVAVQFVPSSEQGWNLPVAADHDGPKPKAEVDKELTYEFGEMPQHATGQRTWTITNAGDADLEIWKGSSTCMCTIAELKEGDKMTLKPGESTEIDLEWKTNDVQGEFHKGANIETNDPDRPTIPLFVHGTINPPVIVIPGESIDLGNIAPDDAQDNFIALYSPDRPEIQITEVKTSNPEYLNTKVEPMNEDELKRAQMKTGWKIQLHVEPGYPIGHLREEVLIKTDHPLRPEIRVTAVGTVSGAISVMPERVRLMNVKSRDGASTELTLVVRGGKAAKIEVADKPKNLDAAIEADESNPGRYKLKVSVPQGVPAGYIDGDIVLKTDQDDAAELRIPVSIVVGTN